MADAASNDDENLKALLEALPALAVMSGCYAEVSDRAGGLILAVDSDGRPCPEQSEAAALMARWAAEERNLVYRATQRDGQTGWAVPVGEYVLVFSHTEKAAREAEIRSCFESALPLIAKVAGGEALVFDRRGQCLMSVLANGKANGDSTGKVFETCRRVMESGRPDVSPSNTFPGAIGVRIPLTRDFGFGFNNASTVQKGQQLLAEVSRARGARYTWADIVGESPGLCEAVRMAKMAAETQSPVWIFGESGTGKELLAQAIHNASSRREKPFVAVNCASLPPSLIESALFGYVEGAFTGAQKGGSPGLFEQADGGTLLLDEISEMDVGLQAKLLRVLQEREVTRIGSSSPRPVDVRIVSTTNRDLRQLAAKGEFREDLFYRLNVVDVRIPPLRRRKPDIRALAGHFLVSLSFRIGKLVNRIDPRAMTRLEDYNWPGNVRELHNCIERAINLAEGDTILVRHLPPHIGKTKRLAMAAQGLEARLKELELGIIQETLRESGGNKSETARRLGISFITLWRKLKDSAESA